MKPSLIFDLDGTLVRCSEYYKAAVEQFGVATEARTGMPATEAEDLVRSIDLCSIKAHGSWMRDRWPKSFKAAAYAADVMAGRDLDHAGARVAEHIAEQTFYAPYPLYDGVWETLEQYRRAGWQLILYTKGDPEVQLRKVRLNSLESFFGEGTTPGAPNRVVVTPRKGVAELTALCERFDVAIEDSWVIGDSGKDDIGPALALGLNTVQVMTSSWEYDKAAHLAHYEIPAVSTLLNVIGSQPRTARKDAVLVE